MLAIEIGNEKLIYSDKRITQKMNTNDASTITIGVLLCTVCVILNVIKTIYKTPKIYMSLAQFQQKGSYHRL